MIKKWTAYCVTCKQALESCPNGAFVEAAAKYHKASNTDHNVLVGYEVVIETPEKDKESGS